MTVLLLLAVLSTASLVHLFWLYTAGRNVDSVVSSLEAGSAAAIRSELESTFAVAETTAEIVRSAIFQGAIKITDEVKREYLFLSLLRSHRLIGWVGFGFPDGGFFGAHSASDGLIEMVEVGAAAPGSPRPLRRDVYRPLADDVMFLERLKGESAYIAAGAPWYRSGVNAAGPAWTVAEVLPGGFEPSLVISRRVEVYGEHAGVLMVAIPLDRLSGTLKDLDFARTGEVYVIGDDGTVLATSRSVKSTRAARLADYPPGETLAEAAAAALAQKGAGAFRTVVMSDAAGPVHVSTSMLPFDGWRLLTAVPRSTFTAEIDRNTRRVITAVFVLVLLAVTSATLFANFLFVGPIRRLAGELRKVERFSLADVVYQPTFLSELNDFSTALKHMAAGLSAFARYMPLDIVKPLVESGMEPKPGGQVGEITVMFADLPGFTELAERLGPDVEPYLTKFLTLAVDAVHREGGTVDKFIGDAVMAIWNAPNAVPDHALRACRAALAIRAAMHALPVFSPDWNEIRVRVAVNTGSALVGNVGSAQRLSYTAIGDTVNLASRLIGVAKEHGVEIVLSDMTLAQTRGEMSSRALGTKAVRGKAEPVLVHTLLPGGQRCSA